MKDLKTLRWIFGKVKSQSWSFVLINILYVVYSVLSIYLIVVSRNVIDGATTGNFIELKKSILILVGVSIFEIAMQAFVSSLSVMTSARLEMSFKQDILQTILKRNYEDVTKFHSGELMTRIVSDVSIILDTLLALIPNILSMVTKLVCAVFLLFQISPEFAQILLVGGFVLFVVVNGFKPFLKKIHKKLQEASSNVRLFFKETFDNLLVIKIFEAENTISEKAKNLQKERYRVQMKRRSLSVASTTGFSVVFQVVYLYGLIWSAYQLYSGNITVGGLTAIVQLISQVQAPIIGLSRSFQGMFGMVASAERIIELEEMKEDVITEKIDCVSLYEKMERLVVEDLSFTYEEKPIFEHANLNLKKGEVVAIYGESGMGKSTFLKLILGILRQQQGSIYFSLKDGEKKEINQNTRGMFTYVPQGNFIFKGSIRENITFVNPSVSENDLEKALEVSCCKSFIEGLPDGLETRIGERGSGLSEGQLQRLSLARAVVSNAPILILDEITSSLDRDTEAEVLENIKNLKNRTCVIVTHRESISRICDCELMVENGKVLLF